MGAALEKEVNNYRHNIEYHKQLAYDKVRDASYIF